MIDEVVLTDELLNEAKKIPALKQLLDGNTLRLIQPFTEQHMNTFKANMYNGAYGQIARANITTSRHYSYETMRAAADFLNRVLSGAYHPHMREQYADIIAEIKKRETKAQWENFFSLAMILVAAAVLVGIFMLFENL